MSVSELSIDARRARSRDADTAWHRLRRAASAPYRRAGRFAYHFAQGKLGIDPVFRGLLERGDLAGRPRVVDIGCGQGLLASLLQACNDAAGWPAGALPQTAAYTGIELMPRDVARAERALAALPLAPRFACADMRSAPIPPCDAAVVLDVLHYIDHADQAAVLARVRAALAPHGRLLLRVGDASATRRYAVSQWVDRTVTTVRGHEAPPAWGRPLADWLALLAAHGFATRAVPMSRGTPFANVLLVADAA